MFPFLLPLLDGWVLNAKMTLPVHQQQNAITISLRSLPPDVQTTVPWAEGTYLQSDVEELWDVLCEVYGSDELAATAAKQVRCSVLCPLYASPAQIRESKVALIEMLGIAEAATIMCKHPAVLTCGSDLRFADPDEIRRLAALRQVLDRIPPEALLASVLGVSAFIGGKIALIQLGVIDPVSF